MSERRFDLEERLVEFSVRIIRLSEALPDSRAGRHVALQLLRSGTAPAPNYGEAMGAESRRDFIHKVRVALKELCETLIWLKVIGRSGMIEDPAKLEPLLGETDELIAILFTSAQTARSNQK